MLPLAQPAFRTVMADLECLEERKPCMNSVLHTGHVRESPAASGKEGKECWAPSLQPYSGIKGTRWRGLRRARATLPRCQALWATCLPPGSQPPHPHACVSQPEARATFGRASWDRQRSVSTLSQDGGESDQDGGCGCWKSNSECGRPFPEGKIIGGQDALKGKWPWQVTLFFRGYHACGGSILSKHWVLTAAHCFDQALDLLDYFKIYVGLTDLRSINRHIQKREIKQVIIHPQYKLTHPNGNDIALVQLSKALKLSYFVFPVCLPKSNINLETAKTCWVTGWGKMRESGAMVDILQETEVPLLDQFLCQILYGSIFFIQEDMICATDLSLMKSPCQGDSGGPLVCKFNDTWFQIGVVTWGKGCSIPLYPGVFARVPYFSTWISYSIQSVIISRSTIIAISWMTLSTVLLLLRVLRTQ